MPNRRLLVVIPAGSAVQANDAAQVWDGAQSPEELAASGATFGGTGLSSSGAPPATHYRCSTVLTEEQSDLALGLLAGLSGAAWVQLAGPDPSGTVVGTNLPSLASVGALDFDRMLSELGILPVDPMAA